jgi:hypothetical protein
VNGVGRTHNANERGEHHERHDARLQQRKIIAHVRKLCGMHDPGCAALFGETVSHERHGSGSLPETNTTLPLHVDRRESPAGNFVT